VGTHRPSGLRSGCWLESQQALNDLNRGRIGRLLRTVDHGDPALGLIAVQHQRDRREGRAVHQQHHHLAVAFVRAVMRARTFRGAEASVVQVKRSERAHPGPGKPPLQPAGGLAAGSWHGPGRSRDVHVNHPGSIVGRGWPRREGDRTYAPAGRMAYTPQQRTGARASMEFRQLRVSPRTKEEHPARETWSADPNGCWVAAESRASICWRLSLLSQLGLFEVELTPSA